MKQKEWGSRGRWFDSSHSDQVMMNPNYIIQVGNVFGFIISIENIL